MLNTKSKTTKTEKNPTEEKNSCLKKSITECSHSPHHPKSKKHSNAVASMATPPSVAPTRSGELNVICEAIVNAKYSHT